MKAQGKGRKAPYIVLSIYAAVCLFCLTWPGYAWLGNRIEPYVLGLPFSFFWIALWVVLTCGVLAAFHLVVGGEQPDAEHPEGEVGDPGGLP